MNENQVSNLVRIGFTDGEAKVYLSLIELGSSTVGPIVKKARVAYSNVYDILNRLIGKGVVSFILKSKTKYFQATSPEVLLEYVNKREMEIIAQKELLKEIIPQIASLQEFKSEQEAEVFVGIKGIKGAYEKLFSNRVNKNEEDLFFYTHKEEYSELVDTLYHEINRKHTINIKSRGIANEFFKNSSIVKTWFSKDNIKFVDFPVPGNIDIFQDKILIISFKQPIIGILIKSASLVDSMKEYFESIWMVAKK